MGSGDETTVALAGPFLSPKQVYKLLVCFCRGSISGTVDSFRWEKHLLVGKLAPL